MATGNETHQLRTTPLPQFFSHDIVKLFSYVTFYSEDPKPRCVQILNGLKGGNYVFFKWLAAILFKTNIQILDGLDFQWLVCSLLTVSMYLQINPSKSDIQKVQIFKGLISNLYFTVEICLILQLETAAFIYSQPDVNSIQKFISL